MILSAYDGKKGFTFHRTLKNIRNRTSSQICYGLSATQSVMLELSVCLGAISKKPLLTLLKVKTCQEFLILMTLMIDFFCLNVSVLSSIIRPQYSVSKLIFTCIASAICDVAKLPKLVRFFTGKVTNKALENFTEYFSHYQD